MSKTLSRRSFLTGSVATGALAAVGLAGCSPAPAATNADPAPASSTSEPVGQHPWEVYPGDIAESEIAETVEQDVVIVGLGASGSYAATSAVENGLSVAVLERNDTFNANGGSHYMFNAAPFKKIGVEVDVDEGRYLRLKAMLSGPMIEKEQRRYSLPGGLTLEVNQVDPALESGFYYAEVEFDTEAAALAWTPPEALTAYLSHEVTGQPGESMAAYWASTRG